MRDIEQVILEILEFCLRYTLIAGMIILIALVLTCIVGSALMLIL